MDMNKKLQDKSKQMNTIETNNINNYRDIMEMISKLSKEDAISTAYGILNCTNTKVLVDNKNDPFKLKMILFRNMDEIYTRMQSDISLAFHLIQSMNKVDNNDGQ